MRAIDLENAIVALKTLVAQTGVPESTFQTLFERHPCILECLGFGRCVAHPRLRRLLDGPLIPDFVAETRDRLLTIIDLKTSEQRVVQRIHNRDSPYAQITQYVSQLRTYREWFVQEVNASEFARAYRLPVNAPPDCLMIAGHSNNDDRISIRKTVELAQNFPLKVITFDDVLAEMELQHEARHFRHGRGDGLGVWMVVKFLDPSPAAPQTLLDISNDCGDERLLVQVVEQGYLEVTVDDSRGRRIKATSVERVVSTKTVGESAIISIDFTAGKTGSALRLYRDGVLVGEATAEVPLDPVKFSRMSRYFLGTDRNQRMFGRFALSDHVIFDRPLTIFERRETVAHLAIEKEGPVAWAVMDEGCWFYRDPNTNNLVQDDPDRRPRLEFKPVH